MCLLIGVRRTTRSVKVTNILVLDYATTRPRSAIIAGLDAWGDINRRLVFIRTPRKSPLAIKCGKLHSGVGLASLGTFPRGSITIDLDQHRTYDEMRDTVAHEFGHICGYEHTAKSDHLMFSREMCGYDDDIDMVPELHSRRRARRFKIPEPADPLRFRNWDKYNG